jgi:tRNA(Ile)-lysidine synthase
LLEINPNLVRGFQQTAFRLRATAETWEEKLRFIFHHYIESTSQYLAIDVALLDMPYALVYLSELLAEYSFSLQQLKSFDFGRVGAQLFSSSHVLTVDRNRILLNKNTEGVDYKYFPLRFRFEDGIVNTPFGAVSFDFVKPEEVRFGGSPKVAFIACESLKEPFEIDLWQQGDKMQPLGMKGKKKISDILINQKVPLQEKKQVMLLKSAGEIVWVIGRQLSDLFKVKKDSTKILRIVYEDS